MFCSLILRFRLLGPVTGLQFIKKLFGISTRKYWPALASMASSIATASLRISLFGTISSSKRCLTFLAWLLYETLPIPSRGDLSSPSIGALSSLSLSLKAMESLRSLSMSEAPFDLSSCRNFPLVSCHFAFCNLKSFAARSRSFFACLMS